VTFGVDFSGETGKNGGKTTEIGGKTAENDEKSTDIGEKSTEIGGKTAENGEFRPCGIEISPQEFDIRWRKALLGEKITVFGEKCVKNCHFHLKIHDFCDFSN
jgi:hypothetical protein